MNIFIIILVATVVCWRFSIGFWPGLSCCVALLVSLPKHVQIPLPGTLPAVTVHRLLVLLILAYWLRWRPSSGAQVELPFKKSLLWILATEGLSVVLAEDMVSSIKSFLYFGAENVMYFFILATVVRDWNDVCKLARAVGAGLFGVAILAFIEKYKGYSPMQYFPGYYEGTVMATFSHRILLGTAMAMGWPLCMLWARTATSSMERRVAWLATVLCIGACYFAQSRGPWISMVLVGLTLGCLGSARLRRILILLGILGLGVWMTNSGVRETIQNRIGSTAEEGSEAQVSYQWRWELWHKAWMEISKSPNRLLLGYGPGASENLSWEGEVSTIADFSTDSFSSWDNNWAAYMLECGLLGFGVLLTFYGILMHRMFKIWRQAQGPQRELGAFVIAALAVFIFMQTNVQIFAPQLYFVFWTSLAAGVALEKKPASHELPQNVEEPAGPDMEIAYSAK
jgi:O-antigen ligase